MQTRDGLSDDIAHTYTDGVTASSLPRPVSSPVRLLAVLLAWLVPGAGHILLGRFGRGLIFFLVITGAFIFGLTLDGRLFWPTVADPPSAFHFDMITVLWFLAQIGSGLCYVFSYLLGFGTMPRPEAATFEYGNTFTFLAGLLNYLVMHDAYDIAAGRKR